MYGSIGKLGINSIPMASNQAIAFASPHQGLLDSKYLFYYLLSQRDALAATGKGAAQKNISQAIIKSWPIPLPPLEEQSRIVAALDKYFSRLDLAGATCVANGSRLALLRRAALQELRKQAIRGGGEIVPLRAVATTSLGKMLDSKRNEGMLTPYLRNINVRWGSFDLTNIEDVPNVGGGA